MGTILNRRRYGKIKDTSLICIFDIVDDTVATPVIFPNAVNSVKSIEIDGTKLPTVTDSYLLSIGQHTIKVQSKDKTTVPVLLFYDIKRITSCIIPDNFTSCGSNTFYGCSNLTDVIISKNITTLPSGFLAGTGIQSFTIPANIVSIDNHCFHNCTSLQEITIPNSLTLIGLQAFNGDPLLKNVYYLGTIDQYINITKRNTTASPLCNLADLYCNGTKVTSVTFTNNILDNCLNGCQSVETIILSEGITSIGQYAFASCSSLATYNIPSTVTTIGVAAFKALPLITTAIIPYGITEIPQHCFHSCSNLQSLTIPSTITTIGDNAFYACNKLTQLYIEDLDAWCRINYNASSLVQTNPLGAAGGHLYLNNVEVTSITLPNDVTKLHMTFTGCKYVENILLHNNLTEIGTSSFQNCLNLLSITIPSSVTSIKGGYIFCGCNSLSSVSIPSSVTTIENSANMFSNCTNIETITIPTTVDMPVVGTSCFRSCTKLRNITLPPTVTSINDEAFIGSNRLESITLLSTSVPTLGNTNTFRSTNNCPIYVLSNLVDSYKAAQNWSAYASRIQAIPT